MKPFVDNSKTRIVTAQEMKALDQMAIEQYGIPSLLLMENAGRGIADIVSIEAKQINPASLSVLIFCGKGNNGGDGLAAARHLSNRGFKVQVLLFAGPTALKDDPAINFAIASRMKIPVQIILEKMELAGIKPHLTEADLVVDALFGVGLNAPLTDIYFETVETINHSQKKVIAVDIPSGLHADTGKVQGAAIKAHLTATLGLPKKGFFEGQGPHYCGEIHLVDIGLPREIL